jgi:hypothetical protein
VIEVTKDNEFTNQASELPAERSPRKPVVIAPRPGELVVVVM